MDSAAQLSVRHPCAERLIVAAGPPQMARDECCDVPADEYCMYHCMAAAYETEEFKRGRDNQGIVRERDRTISDDQSARCIKGEVIAAARAGGDNATADRLALPGVDGYPGMDELKYLAKVAGGQIDLVLTAADGEKSFVTYGSGSLCFALQHCQSVDGDGHSSDHWLLLQSWMAKRTCPFQSLPADVPGGDRRQDRQESWKEAAPARSQSSPTSVFEAT